MNDVVIRAEGIGKRYLIGHQTQRAGYSTLRDTISATAGNLARSVADMVRGRQLVAGDEIEELWALANVSFELRRGEILGIIGRNGAGKSTLLKILSRVTEPTTGRVVIKGRVASLLEVGTGFHPELTGRENIYLNGAILGMSRAEIRKKFDGIVAFAEVEKFVDTPVKRYSSGMYVRLAFAVAAHLEPEILIVDEVLAVGDVEFQRKCLGKMQDVAGQGRTILFVSHNMAAVASLTHTAMVLQAGRVALIGPTAEAMKTYSTLATAATDATNGESWGHGQHTRIRAARLLDDDGVPTDQYTAGTPFKVEIEVETDGSRSLSCELVIVDQAKTRIALATLHHFEGSTLPAARGVYRVLMSFPPLHLAAGRYGIDVLTSIVNQKWDHQVEAAASFEVLFSNPAGLPWNFRHSAGLGAVALPFARPTIIERIHGGKAVGRDPPQDVVCRSSAVATGIGS
jgi:homopolymeric O-antigen transport system ATP-binding protein